MAVVVSLEKLGVARIEARVWTSDVPGLAGVLMRFLPEASGADPDPDLTAAAAVVERFGGAILQRRRPFVPANGVP